MNDPFRSARHIGRFGSSGEYAFATLTTAIAFGLAFVADRYISIANLSLIFLTAVMAVAVRTRMIVAVYTAALCFLGYNFFFTPPRYTFAMADVDDVLTVGLFLIVALVCSRLATQLAHRVESLRAAQARARTLLRLGQRLAACTDAKSIYEVGAEAMTQALNAGVAILVREGEDTWRAVASSPPNLPLTATDLEAADWSERHAEPAGRFADALREANCWIVPLGAETSRPGVAALRFDPEGGDPDYGQRDLALAMAQDIGLSMERARLAEALEQARVQGETERLRSALLSSVSHDLRSPLVSMIGAAGTLAAYEEHLPREERRQLMEAILEEGQRLDRYIQNLLDMTRLGHGTLQLNRDWVDAAELVLAAISRLRRLFPKLCIETALPTDTVLLYVHPALIEQALFNILENAAHFSPQDAPVRVDVVASEREVVVEVTDRGPGIPEEERSRIFDTFYSVSRGDRGTKGTGLGLSICRGMIGAHGGQVEALPGSGGGTTIRVTLPRPPAPGSASP